MYRLGGRKVARDLIRDLRLRKERGPKMPTTRKLAELFRAISVGDVGNAATVAAQICKSEDQKGHRSAARFLRGALSSDGALNGSTRGDTAAIASSALVRLPTDVRLGDVILSPSAREELRSVIHEWKHREILKQHGLSPRAKILFHGPAGCGKSFTARALGGELELQTYVVRFDAVIGAYLGQTAVHLRQIFHFAETRPCVLLLDELDALGKRRGNPLDVGELDRIVIALMQELEHSKPQGLIIGTSNLPRHLDDALWRRFDLTLHFRAPTCRTLERFAKRIAARRKIGMSKRVLVRATKAHSFADAESIIVAEARRQALRNV